MKPEASDYSKMYESYVTLLEIKNSRNNRIQFVKKFGTSEEEATRYIDDFTDVQNKITHSPSKDMFGPRYSDGREGLQQLDSVIRDHQGDVAHERKKERLIQWARDHKNKIIENESGIVVKIDNHEDSKRFSQMTRWCTTTACSRQWDKYEDENVTFFYIINLNVTRGAVPMPEMDREGDPIQANADFFAIAVFPMSWTDLHAKRPDVALIPNDNDEGATVWPMWDAAQGMNLNIGDLEEKIEEIWDDYWSASDDIDNEDRGNEREEEIADVQDIFAKRFVKAWDDATGGAPAMEAYTDDDQTVDPIALIKHFNIPGLIGIEGIKAPTPLEGDERLDVMISDGDSMRTVFGIYSKHYIPAHKDDAERMDPRYDPAKQYSPQRRLKPRWPALEAFIKKTFNAAIASAGGNWHGLGREANYDRWQKYIYPYLVWSVGGGLAIVDTFFDSLIDVSYSPVNKLYNDIMSQEAPIEYTYDTHDGHQGMPAYSDIANTIYEHMRGMTVYADVFSYIQSYYEVGGISPDSYRLGVHEMRMAELLEMIERMKGKFSRDLGDQAGHVIYKLPQIHRVDKKTLPDGAELLGPIQQ